MVLVDRFTLVPPSSVGVGIADSMCGVTRSTDLIPAEAQDFGSSRGRSGRVTNSYGVPAIDSSEEVLVAGVCESEGVVMATEARVLRGCNVGRRIGLRVAGER